MLRHELERCIKRAQFKKKSLISWNGLHWIHSLHLANTNHRFKEWTSLGLATYYSLINKGEVRSFQDLQDLYGLQNLDHFRYLQKPMLSHNSIKKRVFFFNPFPVCSSMSVSRLEPELQEKIRASHPGVERVYFNKGLWAPRPLPSPPLPSPKTRCHHTVTGRGPLCQRSSLIQCAKVKFVSPPHLQQSGRAPASRWRSCWCDCRFFFYCNR